jgi:hypothetical protein
VTLIEELSDDPLARGYQAMSTDQLLASLTAVDRQITVETVITDRTLYSRLGPVMAESILSKLEAASATDSTIKRAVNWIEARDGFNIGDPISQAMVDQLVAGGLFSPEEGAAIKGLAVRTMSRSEELGLTVDWGVVNSARAALGWSIA